MSLASAQTMAVLQGRVLDPSGAAVPGASVVVRNSATGFTSTTSSDGQGRYHVPGIPAGAYQVTAEAPGFRSERIEALTFEVGRTWSATFQLTVDTRREAGGQRGTAAARSRDERRRTRRDGDDRPGNPAQRPPLHRSRIAGARIGGAVANRFSSPPIRGTGALAFNTAGNREEAVGYIVNGVSTTNMTFGQLNFAPPVASIQEFKIDNSTFSAEYGHVSGAIVNLVTRSGTDQFRGEAFEFFRHDALDARNFFEFTTPDPHPFERHQFGGAFGGPIVRSRTFFFATYEGLRQRQGTDMNGVVLSDDQRAAATDPVVRRLIPLIPRANYSDADGTPRFVGAADARVDQHTWTADVRHNAGTRDRLLVFWTPAVGGRRANPAGHQHSRLRPAARDHLDHADGERDAHVRRGLLNEARLGGPGGPRRVPGEPAQPAGCRDRQRRGSSDRAAADDRRRCAQFWRPGHCRWVGRTLSTCSTTR